VYHYFDICGLQFGVRISGFVGVGLMWLNLTPEKEKNIPGKKKQKKRSVKFLGHTHHIRTSPWESQERET
jgi:hypothetical protein